jgi:hypothetical protein
MAKPRIESLLRVEEPRLMTYAANSAEAYELSWALQADGAIARVLRGAKMSTHSGLFDEMGAALQFPAYFGANWAALEECLTDMLWLRGPAYILIVTDADRLLSAEEPDSLSTLLKLLDRAGHQWGLPSDTDKPWGHGSLPFHVLFQVPQTALKQWNRRLAETGTKVPLFGSLGPVARSSDFE